MHAGGATARAARRAGPPTDVEDDKLDAVLANARKLAGSHGGAQRKRARLDEGGSEDGEEDVNAEEAKYEDFFAAEGDDGGEEAGDDEDATEGDEDDADGDEDADMDGEGLCTVFSASPNQQLRSHWL